MQRIDDATAATSLPTPEAAGTPGYFTEGNPTGGTPATNVRGSWLNMVQEELMAVVAAGGLTPSKTVYTQVRDAIKTMVGAGRLLNVQKWTGSGTFTYTRTAGCNAAYAEVVGGGGSGGGTPVTGASQCAVGGGGASGAFASGWFPSGIANGTTITIGAGGAQVNGGSNPGGSSSIGSVMTAPGGKGGTTAGPTTAPWLTGGGSAATSTATGGNLLNTSGQSGDSSFALTSGSALVGGAGASSVYGNGGAVTAGNTAGNAGVAPGSGGSGVATGASQATLAGGPGAAGAVFIYEYA